MLEVNNIILFYSKILEFKFFHDKILNCFYIVFKINDKLDLNGEIYLKEMKSPISEAVRIAKKYDNV